MLFVVILFPGIPQAFNKGKQKEKADGNPTPTVEKIDVIATLSASASPASPACSPATSARTDDKIITQSISPTPALTPEFMISPTPTPIVVKNPTDFVGQSEFKTYMSWTAITLKTSPQYRLQQQATTGEYGIRVVDGRYCVALGSYWAREIGTEIDIYMVNGDVLHCILGYCKRDEHTDPYHQYGKLNGDVLEFIVDTKEIPSEVKRTGSFNCIFPGKVSHMEIVDFLEP